MRKGEALRSHGKQWSSHMKTILGQVKILFRASEELIETLEENRV
jgi:hypothetical protein